MNTRTQQLSTPALPSLLLALALAITKTGPSLAGGFSNTGQMNVARYGQNAWSLANGEVLVLGGANSLAAEQSAELYNPATGKWTLLTGNPDPAGLFGYEAVLLLDGDVLVAGGSFLGSGGQATNGAALFNPSTGTYTPTGSMNVARNGFMFFVLPNGKVLAAGGDSNFSQPATAELYDPATGTWTPTGSLPGSYDGYTAVLLGDGEVLAVVAQVTGSAYVLYDPATGSWTPTTSSPPVLFHLIGVLPDGLAWGADETYDPSTAQWTTFAPPSNRGGFAILATGQALAAGGTFKVNARPYPIEETLNTAQLWDPSTLAWTSTGDMKVSRTGQSMILLLNGQVLIAGGQTFSKSAGHLVPTATAELYTP
jgi:hypothetical protein